MEEKLLDFREAQNRILQKIKVGEREPASLADSLGRILGRDLIAGWDLPRFDNSAMDGFALRSSDGRIGAELDIIGTAAAGSETQFEVTAGKAVRIMTGALIPHGADAVIPVERVRVSGNVVRLQKEVVAGDHIRRRGEDVASGSVVLPAGSRLTPAELGLLATFGRDRADVYCRPKVSLLATGDELIQPGRELDSAKIYDSNTAALCAAVTEAGGVPNTLGIARDERASLESKIEQGLKSDLLVTVAGASVGEFDLVRDVLADFGAEEIFWGVALKPGKPTAFLSCRGTPVFCLPGNPVSAFVTFNLFVRPALQRMCGRTEPLPEVVTMPLAEAMHKKPGRTLFARVRILKTDGGCLATSAGSQQTGIMTSLAQADGLAILPADRGQFARGEKVDVMLLRPW